MTIIPIVNDDLGTITKGLVQRLEDLEITGWGWGDHKNYSIVEIGQNTEKNPGDLRRLTQTPVENHQLKLI